MSREKTDLEILKRRAVAIITEEGLIRKLEGSRRTGKPLRVKLGIDPSSPRLHLGNAVTLRKLREFQDLGHTAVLIVGDFTGRIGDPSGRTSTRRLLSKEEVAHNMARYQEQAFKILDPKRTEFRYNSEWLASMNLEKLIELASKYTVARMLEREDFAKRFRSGKSITILEFLYPLAQAYDSIAVQADVELGGTDQTFNLLAAREIMERCGLEPQVIMTLPLLPGTDGVLKMSKSFHNDICLDEPPQKMYGKLMAIPDRLIEQYVKLCTDLSWEEMRGLHPKSQKQRLAWEIVRLYHNKEAADAAQEEFESVFSRRERPQDVPSLVVSQDQLKPDGTIWIVDLIQASGLVSSRSEARRLIEQGAVELDGQKIGSAKSDVKIKDGMLLRVGKYRFVEICLRAIEGQND